MGQQQLLLIVLGVIIVGIAVVVGINTFSASSVQANRDAVLSDLMNVANMAQQHYKKPGMMGGGGNTYDGSATGSVAFAIPANLATTANGTYAITANAPGSITLQGIGTETGNDGSAKIQYTIVVTPTGIGAPTTVN